MAYEVRFETGQVVTFESPPSQADIDEVAKQFAPKSSPGVMDYGIDTVKGAVGGLSQFAGNLSRGGAHLLATGTEALGFQDAADRVRQNIEKDRARDKKWQAENIGMPTTMPGQVAEGVAKIAPNFALGPAAAPALMTSIADPAMERLQQMNDMGVDSQTAVKTAQQDVVGNAALGLIPGIGAVKGGLVNAGTGLASDWFIYEELKRRGYHEVAEKLFDPTDPVTRLTDLIVGGIGGKAGNKPAKPEDTNVNAGLDAVDKQRKAGAPPQENIWDLIKYAERAQDMTRQARETPIHVDQQGNAGVDPGSMRAMADIEGQQTGYVGGQQGGILPPGIRKQLEGELNPQRGPGLDMAPELPPNDRGSRPVGTDGTPLRGMAEDVPTIDFPLRQEVLEQPEIKAAIDAFRVQIADALEKGDQAKVDQLVQDFTAGMQRLGIAKASDAYGRALYEGGEDARYLETGIRRGGTENPQLQTQVGKQLPFGGKQPTAAEKSTWAEALDKWRRWKTENAKKGPGSRRRQGGFIHPDLLTLGVGKLLDRMDPGTVLSKFAGTFHPKALQTAMKASLDPESNEVLVLMKPSAFHNLAAQRGRGHETYAGSMKKRQNVRDGLNTEEGLHGIPHLYVDENTGKVHGHEGRHRMDVFKEKGLDLVPVLLKITNGENLSSPSMWRNVDGKLPFESLIAQGTDYFRSLAPEKVINLDKNGRPSNAWDINWVNEQVPDIDYDSRLRVQDARDTASDPKTTKSTEEFLNRYAGESGGARFVDPDQRGGAKGTWNPFKVKQEIIDFAQRISDTLSKGWPKSQDQMAGDAMKRIPGMRDITYIPEDVPFSPEVKQKILTEKDGPNMFGRNVTPGFVMYKEFWKSTMVQNVGRAFENARNRYEALKNNQLSDMKKTLNKVMNKPEESKMLHDIFMREFKNGSKYTPEELAQAGVPPRVIEAHAALRTNFDAVLKLQNDALKAKGKPEIKGLEAYFSSRFLGPWKAIARTADGKPVWSISERSALGRARAIKYLKKHAPDLQITDMKYDSTFTPGADSLMAGYRTMIQLLGPDDPAVQRIKELMEAYAREDTENVAGQEQHFKKKTGRRGFAGDRPWAKNDARDFIQQQLEYIENGMQWAEQQKALEQAKLYTEDPEIVKAQPNNVKYIQDLAKAEMGIGTLKEMKNVEDALGKYTGWNPNSYARGLGISKSIFYMKQLGMNLPFMTISLLQPGLVLLPSHLHAGTNMLKGLAGAAIDGPAMAAKQLAEDMMASNRFTSEVDMRTFEFSDKLAQEAYEFAKANRVTELSQLSETRDISQPPSVLLAEKTIGATISGPELVSRSMMYMSFVRGLEGKFDTSTREGRLALFQKAAELTQFSMGVYEPTQKPLAYQKLGMAGNALFTLQTFIFNQLGQVSTYGKDFAKGNPLPLTAYLFSMWAFAGAMGMIGIDDAEELLNTIKRNVPSSVYAKIKDWSIKDFILQNMGETGAYGLASKLSGTNIYTRASMGDILNLGIFESDNTTFLESYLPFLTTMAKDAGAVATLATNPTEIEKRQAQYQLTPTGFRGLFEENVSGMKDGNAVRVPSNLKREASVRRTPEESALRETGFRSLREQQQIDRGFSAQTQTKIGDMKRTNVANRLVDHALVNDWAKFQKELPTFIELDGDLNQVVTQLNTVQKKRLFTIIEAEAYKEPKTMAQAKKVIKYQKILNDLRQ